MNRVDFQMIAFQRHAEAKYLLAAKQFSGAYYLAGYVIECSLKSCIAKSTQEHDFPEKKRVDKAHSHDLAQLLTVAGLEPTLRIACQDNTSLAQKWATAQEWSEVSRYKIWDQAYAESMLDAVGDGEEGLFLWLTQHW